MRRLGKAARAVWNRRRMAVAATSITLLRKGGEFLSLPFPGSSGGVPDVEDFNSVVGDAVKYLVPVTPNHLHAHIRIVCSL
jgi:hypothetical protein